MARIEKTVFISYRRADVYTALAVYENLKNQGYDVFFDYRSISSGDFEQLIHSNIQARAHFVLILTPTALDRCNEPGDWLRREIEIAIDEKRNIVPLFFKGFRFGTPSVVEKLTGSLQNLSRYNGLNVHEDFFEEAMHRLQVQYLNIPLDTILHPVSTEVRKVVREEQLAADKALEKIEDVKELVKRAEVEPELEEEPSLNPLPFPRSKNPNVVPWRLVGVVTAGLLMIGSLIWGGSKLLQNLPTATPAAPSAMQTNVIFTSSPSITNTSELAETRTPSTSDATIPVTTTLGIGSIMEGKDGMTLLYVPAGNFTMGSNSGALDQMPVHIVELDAFWIDQTEVTNAMYAKCVQSGPCSPLRSTRSNTRENYYAVSEFDNYPVIYVTWIMADTYCKWANRSLPTEAKWEKAARGDDARVYPWGSGEPNRNLANYDGNDTTPVGTYPNGISPYGALDMAGNVWEWVADRYNQDYYEISPSINPPGPNTGEDRVQRGGSWVGTYTYMRVTQRNQGDPRGDTNDVGFRCAMSSAQ